MASPSGPTSAQVSADVPAAHQAAVPDEPFALNRLLHVLVIPVAVAAVAVIVSAFVGHLSIGLLAAAGVALGAFNGLLMERGIARLNASPDPTRKLVVKGALGRLALITVVAFALAVVFRPDGWVLLLTLACYQILTLLASLGAAAREARLG